MDFFLNYKNKEKNATLPPGRIKIVNALIQLLETKNFDSITTNEIAKTAGVTEALIYKYFKDKRDLMHEVLREYLEYYVCQMKKKTRGIADWKERLHTLLKLHFQLYSHNRVLPKILILEVRNSPKFYESTPYKAVIEYSRYVHEIIEEGIRCNEIRNDIPSKIIRQFLLGSFEHLILPRIIFNLEIDEHALADNLCKLIFQGILKKN
jgi:TetR/AcrR family fatty acid metabolism transcriptional regulator